MSSAPPPREQPIRLLIVDDDPLVRAGLTMMLGGGTELLVVGEASDGIEAEQAVATLTPDVVLMDIRMPRRDGLATTKVLMDKPSPPKIIVLTTFDNDDSVLTALRVGASGFLLKDTPPQRIVDAIRRVADGEPMLSPSVTVQLIAAATAASSSSRQKEASARIGGLSEREREVAIAIGHGRTNAEIAAELYMSVATVKAHITHLFAKLSVDNRVQIAMCVHDAGLV